MRPTRDAAFRIIRTIHKNKEERTMKKTVLIFFCIIVCAGITLAQSGTKKKRTLPYDYGKVVLNNRSEKAGLSPVVFNHWLHRAKFTCRLCHVDIGFAMKAGGTDIKAADNMAGYYCGACHNGKRSFSGIEKMFEACSKKPTEADAKRCDRCHSLGKNVKRQYEFDEFTAKFPKERFGNGINWEEAEAKGVIKPLDFLEGVSFKRQALAMSKGKPIKDMPIVPQVEGMPSIVFSHTKHAVWNGCELCHPEIFISVKKGSMKYTMFEIFEGKYCGVCHGKVAFPTLDCQRCHSTPVAGTEG
jgi:c(7)-type cytochrome triheme protein